MQVCVVGALYLVCLMLMLTLLTGWGKPLIFVTSLIFLFIFCPGFGLWHVMQLQIIPNIEGLKQNGFIKQNLSTFFIRFEFGNFSLPFSFRFPFPSLLSEYNTEKHSQGFHSCLPSWPDELGKNKPSVKSPGPAVKMGLLWACSISGVVQRHTTNPFVFCPAGGSPGLLQHTDTRGWVKSLTSLSSYS